MRTLKVGFLSMGFAALLLAGVGSTPAKAQQWTYAEGRQVRFKSDVEQKGYRDGLRRGRLDARSDIRENLKDIASYRSGDAAYKYGFRRGYYEGKITLGKIILSGIRPTVGTVGGRDSQ